MKIKISKPFLPDLYDQHRYLIECGGRGSGKSEFAGRKIYYRCETEGRHRFLIMRKVRKTCKESVIEVMKRILDENEVDYEYNKTDRLIAFLNDAGQPNELLFDGLDDPEKIKSIKGLTGGWVEEVTEFTERDFLQLDLCLREPSPFYKQWILTFNPDEALAPWLKRRFFDEKDPEALVHRSTIADNPIPEMVREYTKQLEKIKDEAYKKIYRWGLWAAPRGRIFDWEVEDLPALKFDDIWYGSDFGFSINPAAVIRIYRKAEFFWLEEAVYETNLTNHGLCVRMGEEKVSKNDPNYFDSAEPKSIQEICDEGFNALPAEKGADSVRSGIDFLKQCKIKIVTGSTHVIEEARKYKWREDKNGNILPIPEKIDDHAMDAIRYGITTHLRGRTPGELGIIEHDVRPD